MITRSIEKCMTMAREKHWSKTYWAIDIHGTILRSNFKRNEISQEFYPDALETMKKLSLRKDIVRILYTCSYPNEIKQYLEFFSRHEIHFDYINENPEVPDGGYGYYKDKFYFNLLMDDKAGFDGETDWPEIARLIEKF